MKKRSSSSRHTNQPIRDAHVLHVDPRRRGPSSSPSRVRNYLTHRFPAVLSASKPHLFVVAVRVVRVAVCGASLRTRVLLNFILWSYFYYDYHLDRWLLGTDILVLMLGYWHRDWRFLDRILRSGSTTSAFDATLDATSKRQTRRRHGRVPCFL